MAVQPYTISVPDDVLEDLRHRLMHVRWPDEIPWGRVGLRFKSGLYQGTGGLLAGRF